METSGYTSLFLSGGGLKVAAFLGSLELIDLRSVRRLYGLSAGSILACMLTLGLSTSQLKGIFRQAEWSRLFSDALRVDHLASFKAPLDRSTLATFLQGLLMKYGVPKGASMAWLQRKSGRTFGCFFVDLNSGQLVLCTSDSHPRLLIQDALLASCSLPAIFSPTRIGGVPCVDAGLFNNAPISLLYSSPQERLLCLVTNVSVRIQRLRSLGKDASLVTVLLMKCSLMTWIEIRRARPEEVTVLEMPEPPLSVHQFRLDDLDLEMMYLQGRISVQTRLLKSELAGYLVVAASFLQKHFRLHGCQG